MEQFPDVAKRLSSIEAMQGLEALRKRIEREYMQEVTGITLAPYRLTRAALEHWIAAIDKALDALKQTKT